MNIIGKIHHASVSGEVMKLDATFFPNPWNEEQWRSLDLSQNILLEWRSGEKLLGFALLGAIPGDDLAHLYKILILPELQGSGEAQAFWKEIIEFLKARGLQRIYLEVEASNGRAQKFYEKAGFRVLRKNKGYYSNGEDALMMDYLL